MKNRLMAEYIILKENRIFFWVLQALWIIIAYNIYYTCVPSVTQLSGGYYTTNILALLFVLGIFFPIFLGAILGGQDYDSAIMNYKLTNESQRDYIRSKLILMVTVILALVVTSFVISIVLDTVADTFQGNIGNILLLDLKRVVLIILSWLVWAYVSFFLAIAVKSVTVSVVCSILIFYMEQFFNNYLPEAILKYGIVWNQKSLLGQFFSDDKAMFGIVQSSFNSYGMAFGIQIVVAVISILGVKLILERRYTDNLWR